jgi:hypothetical protein
MCSHCIQSRAKRSRQALARRKEHLKEHLKEHRVSVKEAVADLLAESFFHPAAAKASLLKSPLYNFSFFLFPFSFSTLPPQMLLFSKVLYTIFPFFFFLFLFPPCRRKGLSSQKSSV